MNDPVTIDMVGEWAEDTLREWLHKWYTGRLEDGNQRRVVMVEDDEYMIFEVQDKYGPNPERRFRIAVTVEEIK